MNDMTTYEEAQERYKREIIKLTDEYGAFRIPSHLYHEVATRLRAVAVAHMNEGVLTHSDCAYYSIPTGVAEELGFTLGDDAHKEKRADKWGAFEKWASEHAGEQFSSEQLVEASGFGYQTTLRFVASSPYFHKIKKNLYECRVIATKHDSE